MHKDERGCALSVDFIVDLDTIGGYRKPIHL
jgi:hypothetical protein